MKKYLLISWILIWYGVIFSVQESVQVSNFGCILWALGVSAQISMGIFVLSRTTSESNSNSMSGIGAILLSSLRFR